MLSVLRVLGGVPLSTLSTLSTLPTLASFSTYSLPEALKCGVSSSSPGEGNVIARAIAS